MKSLYLLIINLLIALTALSQVGFQNHIVINNTITVDGAESVRSSDIDGDGDMDIIAASREDGNITWYENIDGQGNFGPQQFISTTAYGASAVYTTDIDNDGDMDVLSSSSSAFENKVVWYRNTNGQGNFSSEIQIASNLEHEATHVHAADIDNDGDMDAISVFSGGFYRIAWHENTNGQGNFSFSQTITTEVEGEASVFASDIDNDGDIDILSASRSDNKVAWYQNTDGLGNFGPQQIISTSTSGLASVYASDLDGDGDVDVLSASEFDDKIAWYENTDGLGSFGAQQTITTNAERARSVFANDMDNDGDMDVLSASYDDDKIAWYENTDGLGNFGAQMIITEGSDGAESVYADDMDNDGDIDVLSASFLADKITWHKNTDGQGNFETQEILSPYIADGAKSVFSRDIDGDGDQDIISASENDDKIAWYENVDGQGTFGTQNIISTNADRASSVYSVDLDNDGDMDVLSASYYDDKVAWYENVDGQGSFGAQNIISSNASSPESVFSIDLDGDGDLDVLAACLFDVFWFENTDGLGTFGAQQVISSEIFRGGSVYSADIDNDGDMDVLSASFGTNHDKIAWYENEDGQGTFGIQQIISTEVFEARSVYGADLDGDGDVDVLSASRNDDKIAWYENEDGQGSFSSQKIITTDADAPIFVYANDVDLDGDMDALAALLFDDKIVWYENTDGLGTFGVQQSITDNANGASSVHASDLDNDGDLDVISSSKNDDKIEWHENLGIVTNEITGFISLDINSDGCDPSDLVVSDVMVISDNGTESQSTFTQPNGIYQFFLSEGTYTTSLTSSFPPYFSVNPETQISNFTNIGDIDVVNFCIEPNQTINDLNISLFPISQARPGFDVSYQLVYHNVGTTQLSGTLVLEFDDSKLNFLNASESPSDQTNNTLTFIYNDLNPLESRIIDLEFNVLAPPLVNIDDSISFVTTINPIAGDNTEEDNVFHLDQMVIGSYDPNDILVIEGTEILFEEADNYLHYIIRFQNTGTADAVNIKVKNTLDDHLDWTTLLPESASHAKRVEIKNGNEVSFIFNGIYLPDSTSNEIASHGYIAYKIKPINSISIGDIISNEAAIFFDFNPPIGTNTVTTEIVDPTSFEELTSIQFTIYPIPGSKWLTVSAETKITRIEIYNRLGQLVLSNSHSDKIDISSLNIGFYFCKVIGENNNYWVKKIIKN